MYRRVDSIFASYKDLIATYNIDKKELYREIIEYAKLYAKYINSDVVESDIPSKSCVERINFMIFTLDCSTMLPYILYVLKNVKNEKSEMTYLDTWNHTWCAVQYAKVRIIASAICSLKFSSAMR